MSTFWFVAALVLSLAALILFLFAAVGRAGSLERAAQILMAFFGAMACLGLWLDWKLVTSAEVVVVFDESDAGGALTEEDLKHLRQQLQSSGANRWTSISFPSLPASSKESAEAPTEAAREWNSMSDAPPLQRTRSLEEAITLGLKSWSQDRNPLKSRRLVVLCRSRPAWEANLLRGLSQPVASAKKEGVVVDLVFGAGASANAMLEISVPGDVLPAEVDFVPSEGAASSRHEFISLRMSSPLLRSEEAKGEELDWVLEEGVIDPPSWDAAQGEPLARLAAMNAASFLSRDETPLQPAKEQRYRGKVVVRPGGYVEWRAPLAWAEWHGGEGSRLTSGHHLLRCRMKLVLPGKGGRPSQSIVAQAHQYIPAVYSPVVFLMGSGGLKNPLASPAELAKAEIDRRSAMQKAWRDLPHYNMPRIPDNYVEDYVMESELDSEASVAKVKRAAVVVVDSLSEARWKKTETQRLLSDLLSQGVHVLFSEAPPGHAGEANPLLPTLPLRFAPPLPARAGGPVATAPATPAGGPPRTWFVNRKPRLTFVVDHSRLGFLRNQPQTKSSGTLEPLAPSALKVQHELVSTVFAKLQGTSSAPPVDVEGLTSDEASVLAIRGTSAPWVTTEMVTLHLQADLPAGQKVLKGARDACPAGSLDNFIADAAANEAEKNAQIDDFLQLWLPSAVDYRLASLVPKELWEKLPEPAGRAITKGAATDPTEVANRPRAEEFSTSDVVIVLAYDVPQARWCDGMLASLAARGSLLIIVPIKGEGDLVQGIRDRIAMIPGLTTPGLEELVEEERKLVGPLRVSLGLQPWDGDEGTRLAQKRILLLDPVKDEAEARTRAETIAGLAERLLCDPGSCDIAPQHYGRWIDERISRRGSSPTLAAPWRFQLLAPPADEAPRPSPVLLADGLVRDLLPAPIELASGKKIDGKFFSPLPLMYGDIRGRGMVAVTSWSLIEDRRDDLRKLARDEPTLSRWSIYSNGRNFPDRWGPQRVLDVFALGAGLDRPSGALTLRGAEVVDARGNLRLNFAAPAIGDWRETLQTKVKLQAKGSAAPSFEATLAHVDPARGELTYELAVQQDSLETGALLEIKLELPPSARSSSTPTEDDSSARPSSDHVFVTPARPFDLNRRTVALAVALARYTGGGEFESDSPLPRRGFDSRSLLLAAAAAALGFGWVLTWIRRWGISREIESESQRELAALTDDPPQPGDVAERGYSLGRPTTLTRSGPFAHYQALEPGDRLDDVVVSDLILWTHTDPEIRQEIIPRVTRRYEEHGVSLGIVVNLGWSMWLPGGVSSASLLGAWITSWVGSASRVQGAAPSPKLLAAIHVVELLAELAWQQGAEITLFSAAGGAPLAGPWRMSPGPSAIREELLKYPIALDAKPPQLPAPDEFPVQRWIYVSDFLHEDFDKFDRGLQQLEAEGAATGGVMVVSSLDRLMTDIGATLPFQLCDRSEANSTDLDTSLRQLGIKWNDAFVDTLGGLAIVSSRFQKEEMLAAIDESRLESLFR